MGIALRISRPNGRFQQWQALLWNQNKRQRAGEFLVQGVRPIRLALELGWQVRTLIYDAQRRLSHWAVEMLEAAGGDRGAMAPELLQGLGGKDEDVPELVAVVGMPRRCHYPQSQTAEEVHVVVTVSLDAVWRVKSGGW